MAIANRIKRLFRADLHAVLDVIEEPEAILKQAIREMQEALDYKRARLARNEKNLELLKSNQANLGKELKKLEEDLKLSLSQGSEELARKTVGRKLSYEKYLANLVQRIANWEKLCERHRQEIQMQESQLESIVEKSKLFVHPFHDESPFSVAESILSAGEVGAGQGSPCPSGPHVSEEEIELEWMRVRDGLKKGEIE